MNNLLKRLNNNISPNLLGIVHERLREFKKEIARRETELSSNPWQLNRLQIVTG